jgi:hypothetical protein
MLYYFKLIEDGHQRFVLLLFCDFLLLKIIVCFIHLSINCLFKGAVSNSDYIESSDRLVNRLNTNGNYIYHLL